MRGRPGSIDHEYNRQRYHLRRLGFLAEGGSRDAAHDDYLRSAEWWEARRRYSDAGGSDRCVICGAVPIQLHHITYARLGFEEPEDLVALCDKHHRSVTNAINIHRYGFLEAHLVERSFWLRQWLPAHLEGMLERIERAKEAGVLEYRGDARVANPLLTDRHFNQVRLVVLTDVRDRLIVDATFRDPPGDVGYELRRGPDLAELPERERKQADSWSGRRPLGRAF